MIRNALDTGMVQVVENPHHDVLDEVNEYLAGVSTHSGVCGEHDPRWLDVLHTALKHRPIVLIARCQETRAVCGYLPLVLVSSRLFGRFLVSLPYLKPRGGRGRR